MAKSYEDIVIGLEESTFSLKSWGFIVSALVLLGSVLYALNYFILLGVPENLTELGGDVFLKYLFIVVAVERAAAVFVGISRNQSKVDWSLRITRISEILKKDNPPTAVLESVYRRENRLVAQLKKSGVIGDIPDVPEDGTNEDYLGYLTSTKHAYEFQRARFDSVSNRYVARAVFFAGILLATLGLSIFQDLLADMGQVTNDWQKGLLRLADIVITGGLLGGGSAGLNALATKMSEFLNKQ